MVYSPLVTENVGGIFPLLYFYGVGCLIFSLISTEVGDLICDLKLCYRNEAFPSVRVWVVFYFFPSCSVVFLKHFDFFMVRILIYVNTQGTFSTHLAFLAL